MTTALVADTLPIANGYGVVDDDLFNPLNNPGLDRPFRDQDGRRKVHIWNGKYKDVPVTNVNPDGKMKVMGTVPVSYLAERYGFNRPTWNAATSLRKQDWSQMDRDVLEAYQLERVCWPDLEAMGTYGGFNGMAKTVLETEYASDPGEAMVDMNGLTEGRSDRPQFQVEGLPLTITHVDYWYDLRTLTASKQSGMGLDTRSAKSGGARIAETLEKTLLGVDTGPTYGGTRTFPLYSRNSSVYGYMNFSARLTKTNLYKPTGVGRAGTGWVHLDTVKDVLAMIDTLRINKFNGPFMLYHSNDWNQYLDADYVLTGGNVATQTLRKRLGEIPAIGGAQNVKNVPFLAASATTYANDAAKITSANPFTMILVARTQKTARAVNGMDVTTVQWEEKGGMKLCFKIMCIKVPQLFADINGYCGILHANASAGV